MFTCRLESYEEASQDYTKAISLNEKNGIYFQQRAIAQKLLGNTDKATADYDKAIAMEPSNVAAWMGRGYIKFQLGKSQEAIDDFSKVIELAPVLPSRSTTVVTTTSC